MPDRASSLRPISLVAKGLVALLVATALTAALAVALLMERNAVAVADAGLATYVDYANGIAQGLRRQDGQEGPRWRLTLPPQVEPHFAASYGRAFYAVLDAEGVVVHSTFPGGPPIIPAEPQEEPSSFRIRRGQLELEGATVPVAIGGERLWVVVADDIGHPDVITDDIVERFLARVSWVVLPAFLLLAAASYGTLRLCLRPIEALSRRAAALRPGERLPAAETPVEIRPLADAMNLALDRAEQAYATQREFTAEAAHQMRTPLAVLMTHAALLEDPEAAAALQGDVQALERLVDQLLALAEIDAAMDAGARRQAISLSDLAQDAAGFLSRLAAQRGVRLDCAVPEQPVVLQGHEEPVSQAIINLVQNALDHTPGGGHVQLRVRAPGIVEVEDDGPGVPEAIRQDIFKRFWSSRKQRGRGASRGTGLGLAIVQRTAELHGGAAEVETAASGGALFRLRLAG